MRTGRNAIAPKEQHPKKRCFKEEGRNNLIAEHGPKEVGRSLGEITPVGTKLERHNNPGYHTHSEDHRKHRGPERRQLQPYRVPGFVRKPFEYGNVGSKTDGEHRKNGVK